MFDAALHHERDLDVNFWEDECPPIDGISLAVPAPDGSGAKAIDWASQLDGYAQSVDQRVKIHGWMEKLEGHGGKIVIDEVGVDDLERHTQGNDLVIVDAPATGHGVGILKTPRTFAEIARVGPIAHQDRTIAATLADRDFTALVAVATAEEMPVNETLAIRDELEREGLALDAVIVNSLYPSRFSARDAGKLRKALGGVDASASRGAIRAALSEHARASAQQEQRGRLRDGLGTELVELPYVFADQLGREELEQLADALEVGLAEPAVTPA